MDSNICLVEPQIDFQNSFCFDGKLLAKIPARYQTHVSFQTCVYLFEKGASDLDNQVYKKLW